MGGKESRNAMKAIEIKHCQAGGVTSRADGSVKLSFVTPELRPSEAGACLGLHGKNVTVSIVPEDVEPEELLKIDTERGGKTPGQRLRACLFLLWKQQPQTMTYNQFYDTQMEHFIDTVKEQLP